MEILEGENLLLTRTILVHELAVEGRGFNLCRLAKTDVGYSNVDGEDVDYMLVEGLNLRQPTKKLLPSWHIRVWGGFYLGQALISPGDFIHHPCKGNIKPGIAAVYNS